ncbi:TPA: transcriptional repressor [Candidatus Avigastranaerophilus faecigallinarum]|nr:transcriptional repressor [Candidatus Avigastranaerophilus faecigallinarum]
MNYSRQREIIFDTLRRHAIHPTAERLYNIIKGEQPDSNIGIATVYRNLRRMANSGSIKKISGLEEAEHFDHNTHTHYHFLCKKCNKVFDIDAKVAPEIIENTQKETGFIIDSYDVVFHGICKDCQTEEN